MNLSISRWELPNTIETYEGTDALSGVTVEWTSPLAGTRNWATGNPATPVFCRHGPGDTTNQAWPPAGNEDSSLFAVGTPTTTGDSGSTTFSFVAAPDFENPSDSGSDNTYKLRLHNIHRLHEDLQDVSEFPACSGSAIDVTVTVINVNEPPVFPSETDDRSVTENTAAGQPIGDPVEAEDPDIDDSLTYTLSGGDDAASFDIIESTGQLQTKTDLDHEGKASYTVTVTATDQEDLSDTIAVTINVTDENETPVVAGNSQIDYPENGTGPVATYTTDDPENGQITWSLSVGDDSSHFAISNAGALTFSSTPDYEAPADAGTNNVYLVEVRASDGNNTGTLDVTVTVTNVNEPPEFPSTETGARSVAENTPASRDIGLPVSATDPEVDTLTYSLDGTDAASFRIIESTGQLQTNADLDFEEKASYTVTVLVYDGKDGSGNADMTTDDTIAVTITVTGENDPPKVTGHSSIDYAENGTADVATYTADDPEHVSITWDLLGDDNSLFSISTLGVLTFKTAPDFEARADADHDNEYLVTVQASDGDNIVTLAVTVTVTDENEPPAFAAETDARTIAEGTEAGVDIGMPVSATDPDTGETLTYSLVGTDAASFGIVTTSGQLQDQRRLGL